jgi:hypothetical protein
MDLQKIREKYAKSDLRRARTGGVIVTDTARGNVYITAVKLRRKYGYTFNFVGSDHLMLYSAKEALSVLAALYVIVIEKEATEIAA